MNFKIFTTTLVMFFICSFYSYSQSTDIMGIMGDSVVNELEDEIRRGIKDQINGLVIYNGTFWER